MIKSFDLASREVVGEPLTSWGQRIIQGRGEVWVGGITLANFVLHIGVSGYPTLSSVNDQDLRQKKKIVRPLSNTRTRGECERKPFRLEL